MQDKLANPKAKPPAANPLLLGLSPSTFVLRAVGRVRSSELEQALLLLPFPDALRLLGYLIVWLKVGSQVRGCVSRGVWGAGVWGLELVGWGSGLVG